jgi:stage V sporulation protein G
MGINITDVRVKKYDNSENKIKAVASITIDNVFVIHDLKVIDSEKGLFVAMPSKKGTDGKFKDIAHPINTETRNMIQQIVLDKFNEVE